MRISLHNVKCIFKRKTIFIRFLKGADKSGFCLNIQAWNSSLDKRFQSIDSVASKSKLVRLRRVGQLLERLAKVGLIS